MSSSGPSGKRSTVETWLPQGEQAAYLRTLTHVGTLIRLDAGSTLFDQGQVDDAFYVVLEGKMHVSMVSEHGSEAILNIMGPGSMIGEAAAMLTLPRFSSARAMVDSSLLRFHVSQLRQALTNDQEFGMALLYLLSIKQRQMVSRLRQAIFDSPERRILDFLKQFYDTHHAGAGPDTPITVNLTHEQIGSLTGLSRVTVTRLINKFRNEGVLEFSGKRIMLTSRFPDSPAINQY